MEKDGSIFGGCSWVLEMVVMNFTSRLFKLLFKCSLKDVVPLFLSNEKKKVLLRKLSVERGLTRKCLLEGGFVLNWRIGKIAEKRRLGKKWVEKK